MKLTESENNLTLRAAVILAMWAMAAEAAEPDHGIALREVSCEAAVCVAAAPAEEEAPASPPQRLPSRFLPQTPEFPGIALGSFLLFPEVVFGSTYDDNIYAERRNTVSDTVFTLSPSLVARSRWRQHALNFELGADLDRYRHHDQEDVNDRWIGFDGRYDLGGLTNVFGGLRYSRDHEDRSASGALDPRVQIEPTLFDRAEAHLGIATGLGPWRLRAGGTYDEYDYKDALSASGNTIDSDFRDRSVHSVGLRLSYVFSPRYEIFAQYATDTRDYRHFITGQAFNRDSDGYRAAVGLRFTLATLRGEAFAGVLHQNFDYIGFENVSKPYFGLLMRWRPTQVATVNTFVERSLEETTVFADGVYASSSLDTAYGFNAEYKLSSDLTLNARAAYTRSQFQGFDRNDKIIDAAAGIRYYIAPTVFVGAQLRLIDRDSGDLDAQYSRNQFLVNVGFTPARSRNYSIGSEVGNYAPGEAAGSASGLYIGAQIGHGALTTATAGVRHAGGADAGDFGSFGESYALFAGWGRNVGNWYFGIEAEGGASDASWYHRKGKDESRTETVNEGISYGIGARMGYLLDGGLLYGKVGIARTDFRTYVTANRFAGGAFDQEHTETGVRWGVGVDIPASSNLFVRMSYSYTDYGEYEATYQTGVTASTTETFDLRKGNFGVGLGWRFDGNGPRPPARDPKELRGFYAGAGVGHGTLSTQLTGLHRDQFQGPFDFTGDFSGSGSGIAAYAGYGHTWGKFYLGAELEADTANFGWFHEREAGEGEVGGRDFAVEKRGSYGANVRVGYVLRNGSLLYARVGTVRTRFNTIYNKGPSTDQWIDRTDRIDGMRYGIGAEVPASSNAFVRADYTYTKYDAYGFVTGHGGGANADNMAFENRENIFRLSIGFRF